MEEMTLNGVKTVIGENFQYSTLNAKLLSKKEIRDTLIKYNLI